jgi:hypothetical protein
MSDLRIQLPKARVVRPVDGAPILQSLTQALFQKSSPAIIEGVLAQAIKAGVITRRDAPYEIFEARTSFAQYGLQLIRSGTHTRHEVEGLAFAVHYGTVTEAQIAEAESAGADARRAVWVEGTHAMRDHLQWSPIGSERRWIASLAPRTSLVSLHKLGHGEITDDAATRLKFQRDLEWHRGTLAAVFDHEPVSPSAALSFLLDVHAITNEEAQAVNAQADANFRRDDPLAWTKSAGS